MRRTRRLLLRASLRAASVRELHPHILSRSSAAAGYEVNDIRDSSVWYYFNVCGATATPQTDNYQLNREQRTCCV